MNLWRVGSHVGILMVGALGVLPAAAGGPRAVNGLGQPMKWDTAGPVIYNPDAGTLGLLSNAAARAVLAQAFTEWAAVADISFSEGASLSQDVDAAGIPFTNPAHYQNFYRVSGDGLSPVIFDADGSIIDAIFGSGARFDILGVGGLDTSVGVNTEITEASLVINGAFFDGVGLPGSPEDVTQDGLKAVMVHEIGHFINLDHSVLNHELALDGNPGNDIYVPTMFPVVVDDETALATTNPDDRLAALNLYPLAAPADSIAGSVVFGGVPFQGANVVLRKTGDPLMTSYSLVSGGLFHPCNAGSTCDPCTTACDPGNPAVQGAFAADHFTAGQYEICVEQIDTRFTQAGGALVGPLATPPILPGPEECYDAAEAGTDADDPDAVTAVTAGGATVADILLDSLPAVDPFEPNDTLGSGATLDDLPGGRDTAPGILSPGDLDVFEFPVVAGQIVRIDLEAAELGSALDAVVGFYNGSNALVALVDDALDLDSRGFSFDPALELVAGFTGTAKVVVSSFPDLDLDGNGGATAGPYWLRVEAMTDSDGDGTPDGADECPADPLNDHDHDGLCFFDDNCPTESNPLQDAPVKLSGPMVTGGDVSSFAMFSTPEGLGVVYLADQEADEVFQLYAAPTDGSSPPVRLNPALGGTPKDVTSFRISVNVVVYLADQDTDQKFELYSVPIEGGAVTKLNGTLPAGGNVLEFGSLLGTHVVYRADQDTLGVDELYSVPIDGGATTKLNGTMTPGGSIDDPAPGSSSFIFSQDATRVIYAADQVTAGVREIFSVPTAGGAATKLNGTLVAGGDVLEFKTSGSGTRIVYSADQEADGRLDLYSVPVAGGVATKLSGTMPGGAAGIASFGIAPDEGTVVYRADQGVAGKIELFGVPTAGGTSSQLSGTLVAGGNVSDFSLPQSQVDGVFVSYRADQEVDERFEIYGVPIAGGSVTKLNGPLASGGDVILQESHIRAFRVLYVADQDTDEKFEVYSVDSGGGAPVKILGMLAAGGDFAGFTGISLGSLGSEAAVLRADADVDDMIELYGVRPAGVGGLPMKLNAPLVPGGDVTAADSFGLSVGPVLYLADQETDEVFELYGRPLSMDPDGDAVVDRCDLCPDAFDPVQTDSDANGVGDACASCALGADPDADAECGALDNCPTVANPNQEDFDVDGAGDACDADDDDDGLADEAEEDMGTDPFDPDTDGDGATDGDEVAAGDDPNDADEVGFGVPFALGGSITTTTAEVRTVFATDVDGDGDVDGLSASFADDTIAWYDNDGASPPGWTKRAIATTVNGPHGVFAADVDGDGDTDALSASVLDDTIAWHENDGASPPGWTKRTIATTADGAFTVFAADVDSDGDLDALSASLNDSTVAWYESDGASPPGWTEHTISTTASGAISVFAADVDGDGNVDVLSASVNDDTVAWYENDGASPPVWTRRTITTTANSANYVFAADMDGDGDLDALCSSALDDTVAWHENDGASPPAWTKRSIDTENNEPNAVFAADIDGDGDLDALSTATGGNVSWHENDGASPPAWTARTIASPAGPTSVVAADLDGDGDLDALVASEDDDRVAWYENRRIHSNAAFPSQSIVGSLGSFADRAHLVDMDQDGDQDLVSGAVPIRWFENGNNWNPVTIQSSFFPGDTSVFDLDRDGDPDVLSTVGSDGELSWNENTEGDGSAWTTHTIPHVGIEGTSVRAADIDGDGDPDVVTTMLSSRISWHENTAGDASAWTEHMIASHTFNWDSIPVDLDRDGDVDVVNVAGSGAVWYDNTAGDGSAWTSSVIGNLGGNVQALAVGDLDGDGDPDVLLASASLDTIEWYENASGDASTWIEHLITASADEVAALAVADLDGDGDLDVVSAAAFSDEVVVHENVAGDGSAWSPRVVTLLADSPRGVAVGDVDNDGRLDVATVSAFDAEVAWYPNRGGQFTLETTVLAPGSLADGATAVLFAIELTSNGRAGDSDVELATLDLTVTDASGATLSSDEANALIERVRIYLDNGSTAFEPGSDTLVTTIETLELSPLIIEFAPGDPRARVAPGQSRTFFLVVSTTHDASAQSPSAFRVQHLTESSSKARDVATGALVEMEFAADTSTATIGAVTDATPPAVTGVYPPDGAVDVAPSTDIVVFMSERVDPASAALGVSLSAGGIKVSGRTSVSTDGLVVSFDADATLALGADYVLQVTSALRDLGGNPAIPFAATFETTASVGAGNYDAPDFGEGGGGSMIEGGSANDNSGFATAAMGDINGISGGIADLIVGAPNAGAGDEGKATLIFGSPALQSDAGAVTALTYETGTTGDQIGETVARAGDLDGDGVQDFLIGAPRSDQAFADAGVVYLVFGDPGLDELAPATLDLDGLAACSVPTLCGVRFLGEDPGDLAGTSVSYAGDVNGDGRDDLVIGAPGASPGGENQAGKAYLIYGPLGAGTISLSQVGSTTPGLVFHGESADDRLGTSVSHWEETSGGDGIDDLLLGAPGATVLDEFGAPILNGGYVYAIQGGTGPGKLDDTATPGVIELDRVAGGGAGQIAGMVFLGEKPDGHLGRSITGALDMDGDGIKDVLMAGNGVAFAIPGHGPKTVTGSTRTGGTQSVQQEMSRAFGDLNALDDLGGVRYLAGDDDPLTVGAGGDMNHDGYDDAIIGAPLADGTAGVDSGKAYVVLGNPAPGGTDRALAEVGQTVAGFVVEGAEAGDQLGASVGGGFDVNADGVDDGLAGAPFADTLAGTAANAGETYVISPISPDEVLQLRLQKLVGGTTRLEWTVPDLSASYNVYRGLLSTLQATEMVRTADMTALACGIATDADADQLPDTDDAGGPPPVADGFVYLVTAENFLGEGPIGPPAAEPPRLNDSQCP